MPALDRVAQHYKYSATTASASVTRPNNTTAYTATDVYGTDPATNMIFTDLGEAGSYIKINGIRLRIDANAVPSGMTTFRLHLYNAAPTAIADNAAYALAAADKAKYVGYIDIAQLVDRGDVLWSQTDNIGFNVKLVTSDLYGILETVGAYTPAATTVATVTLYAQRA